MVNPKICKGKPCKKCGNDLYYIARKTCVSCHMKRIHKKLDNKDGWPNRINADKAMSKVKYEDVK